MRAYATFLHSLCMIKRLAYVTNKCDIAATVLRDPANNRFATVLPSEKA